MAESTSADKGGSAVQSETPKSESQKAEETNKGVASREAYASADLAVAEAADISEGEVKALRDDAGLNRLAGHEADVHAWSITPAGKQFAEGEKDRQKAAKDEAKAFDAQTNDKGLTEAEAKYAEAVKG